MFSCTSLWSRPPDHPIMSIWCPWDIESHGYVTSNYHTIRTCPVQDFYTFIFPTSLRGTMIWWGRIPHISAGSPPPHAAPPTMASVGDGGFFFILNYITDIKSFCPHSSSLSIHNSEYSWNELQGPHPFYSSTRTSPWSRKRSSSFIVACWQVDDPDHTFTLHPPGS